MASIDQTTDYTYDGDNHVLTMTAEVPGGTNQITQYGYAAAVGYAIFSNDLADGAHVPVARCTGRKPQRSR